MIDHELDGRLRVPVKTRIVHVVGRGKDEREIVSRSKDGIEARVQPVEGLIEIANVKVVSDVEQ